MIPSSFHVPASVNRGVPIILDEPRHPVSQALRSFADRYILIATTPSSDATGPLARFSPAQPQTKARRRLFHKSVS
jgi:pilus assembly protein CpaE